ncbi:MAG: M23 family metallopeptidase, partial [bacterium]|nr:M23 family metallopeptidase [bacterium]
YILKQGDTLFIKIESAKEPKGTLAKSKLSFLKINNAWLSVYGIDAKKTPGNYRLTVSSPQGRFDKYVTVVRRNFPVTNLVVTKELRDKGYSPAGIQEEIAGKEGPALSEILNVYNPNAYFYGPFAYPLDKIDIGGDFGNIRKSGQIKLQHLGVDLDADTGVKVYASNNGKVVFMKNLSNDGNTIIIDHGLGIYSLYLHLNEFKISLGDMVKRGDVIATVGNTGYSIGPHLHFSVKINNGLSMASVDPLRFIKSANKMMQ